MKRGIGFRLGALAFGGLLSLLLAEGVIRVSGAWIGRHSDTMFTLIEFDPQLGWKMPAGQAALASFVDRENIPVTANRWGFWDREREVSADGRCRVACLGDSFTWGMGIPRELRFTDQLEADDSDLEVMNFGMPGYGTDQALLVWRQVASRFAPAVVVLTVYQNDFGDNHFEFRYGRAKPYFAEVDGRLQALNVPVPEVDFWQTGVMHRVAPPYRALYPTSVFTRSRAVQWLGKYSDLVRMAYTAGRTLSLPDEAEPPDEAAAVGAVGEVRPLSPQQQAQADLEGDLAGLLQQEAREAGAQLLVVMAGDPVPQFEELAQRLRQMGVPVVDATTGPLTSRLADAPAYFRFNRHWTPEAHREVARMLNEQIRDQELCPGAEEER